MFSDGQKKSRIVMSAISLFVLFGLSACAGIHSKPVSINGTEQQLRVIGLPHFSVSKKIDIRRENPVYAIIAVSAKVVQQLVREHKRFKYRDANPKLLNTSMQKMRQGMILAANLYATQDRKLLSSKVYNVGYDREDISQLELQVGYISHIQVADQRYFYKDFDALMTHATQSSKGLRFVATVAGDLKRESRRYTLAKR